MELFDFLHVCRLWAIGLDQIMFQWLIVSCWGTYAYVFPIKCPIIYQRQHTVGGSVFYLVFRLEKTRDTEAAILGPTGTLRPLT